MNDDSKHTAHDDIGCLEAIETLYAYLDGELNDEVSIDQVEKHMEHCRSCYSRKDVERALSERIRKANQQETPEALQDRLRKLMSDF